MHWKRYGTIAVALIVLLGGAYAFWLGRQSAELPAGIVSSNGRIEAERIDVAAKLPGRIAEVRVSEGQWVEAGDLVAHMDTAEIDAQLRQAQAAVTQAEQQKLQTEALLNQRLSEQEFAQAEFARAEQLAAKGHVPQELVDQRRATLITADAGVAAARAGIDLATATIASAEATVERLQSIRADAELVAPHRGRVQYVLAKAGEVVGAGGRVVTLTDLTDIYMTIFLPARDAGLLAIGAEARIVLDPIPDYVVPAQVTFVASSAQFTPKSVETADERDQLMFRVKLTIPADLLEEYQQQAKAGVAGVGYVRVDDTVDWPDALQVKLPQ
ncbi:HlyD family secretion protein [Pukyongiella litopenaei]|uniref:HlyD family efflux transporter periplasmic adaptor subunit n=1 Tax=Pukyongiella litopenaei TaxID=2605946 RepID=A0A2S0MQY0_9RHOB|nr:HlyD family efflux transporter periplasmic adaptor subunit [Pukyongiella litopenaei]AVO38246.1 HlyD family efflux transporter periplasmic adaptor subunit [Pukyongiella litopenaei]